MLIESTSNPLVKELTSLGQPKGRAAHGQFLVEGVRAIEDALRAEQWPLVCLYSPELLIRTERGAKLLRELKSPQARRNRHGEPIEASRKVLEAVSDTQHPQGIVAAFSFLKWSSPAPVTGIMPLALVCDNIQDPGNLGTILRTAEAAGAQFVWLSPGCADLYNPKVVRAAMGAHFRLPVFSCGWAVIEAGLSSLGITKRSLFVSDTRSETPYDAVDWRGPSALIVSNEAHGASAEARSLAGSVIGIPMAGETESLNAAISAAIILFEVARQRRIDNAPRSAGGDV